MHCASFESNKLLDITHVNPFGQLLGFLYLFLAGDLKFCLPLTFYLKFLEHKYLVDSFYIFLCPLAELVTLSSSMPLPYTCREQPGDTQQLSPTLDLLSITRHMYGRDINEESVTSSAKRQRNIQKEYSQCPEINFNKVLNTIHKTYTQG